MVAILLSATKEASSWSTARGGTRRQTTENQYIMFLGTSDDIVLVNPTNRRVEDQLFKNAWNRLELVQAKSASFVQLVPALSALLYSAFAVIAGANTLNEAPIWYLCIVIAVVTAAFLTLGWGTYEFYKAAYGDPQQDLEIDPLPSETLATRFFEKQRELIDE